MYYFPETEVVQTLPMNIYEHRTFRKTNEALRI